MPPVNSTISDINREVMSIKSDMTKVNTLVDRLDITIEKLSDISTNISQLLAVQENRLTYLEKLSTQMSALIEKRKDEAILSDEQLHQRINIIEKEFKSEIEKVGNKALDHYKQTRDENKRQHDDSNRKMVQLEKWIWVVTGGAAVIGFIISQIFNIIKYFGPN